MKFIMLLLIQHSDLNTQMLRFYSEKDDWGEFSNFYPSQIVICGITYPTSEHYYQAQKYMGPNASDRDLEYAKLIREVNTPNKSKILARHQVRGGYSWIKPLNEMISNYPDVQIRPDWENVKDNIMRAGVMNKFLQHPQLLSVLLSTDDKVLVEHTSRDSYWADGGDGTGKNMLGKILMETRFLLMNGNLGTNRSEVRPKLYQVIPDILYIGNPIINDLNYMGINFLVDLTEHTLDQHIFGKTISDPIYVYQDRIILIQDDIVNLTRQGIGLGRKIFIYGNNLDYQNWLPKILDRLYSTSTDLAILSLQ